MNVRDASLISCVALASARCSPARNQRSWLPATHCTPRPPTWRGRSPRPRAVDEIADAQDRIDAHRLQRIEHSPERLGLAVNVADDPQPAEHAWVAHSSI